MIMINMKKKQQVRLNKAPFTKRNNKLSCTSHPSNPCVCEHGLAVTGAACTEPDGNICESCDREGEEYYLANNICYPMDHPRPRTDRWLPDTDYRITENQNVEALPADMTDPCRYGKDQYGKTGTRERSQTLEAGVIIRGSSFRENQDVWPDNDLDYYIKNVYNDKQVCFGGYGNDRAEKQNEDIVGKFEISKAK